jgi:tripartite-type tricarboxylate transporter receptor subunit TctC
VQRRLALRGDARAGRGSGGGSGFAVRRAGTGIASAYIVSIHPQEMRMRFPSFRPMALLVASVLAFGLPAGHAAYPDKPIRIVVTFAAGGASDIVARIIAEPLGKALGQAVISDNKPGAGGTLGGLDVVRAPADGYTLMLSNSTPLSIGPFTAPKPPYDPIKQFTHVSLRGVAPVLIMANPKTGPATLKDLPKAAAGGNFSFGSGGPAGLPKDVTDRLHAALAVIVADPAIARRFEELGITPARASSAEFAGRVAPQVNEWAPIIQAADLK